MCPRPYNRDVRLIKVSCKVNKGNKFGDLCYCPFNRGSPLNTGFEEIEGPALAMPTIKAHTGLRSCASGKVINVSNGRDWNERYVFQNGGRNSLSLHFHFLSGFTRVKFKQTVKYK